MEKLDQLDSFLADFLGVENEYELLNKKSKVSTSDIIKHHLQTPEEIEMWCTKEDMGEVKRCAHLMKKGYEIQKISVSKDYNQS